MNRFYKWLLCLVAIFYAAHLAAAPIDSLRASKAAANFMVRYADRFDGLVFVRKEANVKQEVMYYVFNLRNADGYVIITADDACYPVLGYSAESKFDVTRVPIQLQKWLWHRAREIAYIKQQKFEADDEIKQEWEALERPLATARTQRTMGVNPLITTKWDQAPFYNDLCPYDQQARDRAVTGCVATAMAQVMKYHNYPQTGQGIKSYVHNKYGRLTADFGRTTYDWRGMPNRVTNRNNAVATLMYHCGVSVEMDYGVEASGAQGTTDVVEAFTRYFGYASSTKYVEKKNYTETNWRNLLKAELDAKRPMYYGGYGGGGGHAFVCDGYDDNNLFHFNWGWDGDSDGYFRINALNPGSLGTGGGDGGYNSGQDAVIGIQPAAVSPAPTTLQLSKRVSITPNPIDFGDDVTVRFNVTNRGNTPFQGDYAAALFDKDSEFVTFIGQPLTNQRLNVNNTYVSDLVFTQKDMFLSEGDYYVGVYFREPQKEWQIIPKGSFENFVKVLVLNVEADLSMFGTPLKINSDPILQNRPFEVTFNVANFAKTTFEGDISVRIYELNGDFVKEVETKTNLSLGASKTFSNALVFKTNGLDMPVGTYMLAPVYKLKNTSSFYVLAGFKDARATYPNLVRVIVAAPPLVPDRFEPNNEEARPTVLPTNFSGSTANVNTEGSNLHVGNDIDYYRLNLPTGFSYEITARVHDRDNSGNGRNYSGDVLFSYKVGSNTYSDAFDVSIGENNSKVVVPNGGNIIFKVAPFFAGEKGTYLLDIQARRSAPLVTAIEPPVVGEVVKIYPNPATDFLVIELPEFSQVESVNLLNMLGQPVLNAEKPRSLTPLRLDVSNYPAGVYFLRIRTKNQLTTHKINIVK